MFRPFLRRHLPRPLQSAYRGMRRKLANTVAGLVRCANAWQPDPRVTIGKYTYGVSKSMIPFLTNDTRIQIGKYCSIAPDVRFVIGHHRMDMISTFPFRAFFLEGGKVEDEGLQPQFITIGNDVWIGSESLVVADVTIGHGAVVAAGAVVVKDVPPYAIVGGVPAKLIRMRFDADTVQNLLDLAWWDWPEEQIRENIELFYAPPEKLLQTFYSHLSCPTDRSPHR